MTGGLRLAYYGDDFTGSVDVMETLACAGLHVALFMDPPPPEALAPLEPLDAVGVAGASRTYAPEQMEAELPQAFTCLARLGASLVHYKVCSTFDSAPEIGSIGRAIDIGQRVFATRLVPLLVASPPLGRYCVFGNLFASSGWQGGIYRLDRHPTMRQHPITPMDEADLRLHLQRQTKLPIGLLDVLQLDALECMEALGALEGLSPGEISVVLIDALGESHLRTAGALLWRQAQQRPPLFAVGSSGIESALVAYWQSTGQMAPAEPLPTAPPVDRLLVLSGSGSPVTERQIAHALAAGFLEVPLPVLPLLQPHTREQALRDVVEQTAATLQRGRSVIVHTARGPQDPRIGTARQALQAQGHSAVPAQQAASRMLGTALGEIARRVLATAPVPRLVISGGDTSGHVVRQMGITRLRFGAVMALATPVCRGHVPNGSLEELELVFKAGQVGLDSFFTDQVRPAC